MRWRPGPQIILILRSAERVFRAPLFNRAEMTGSTSSNSIRLAAVGDLLLAEPFEGSAESRKPEELFGGVRELLASCDVVFGNLECSLPGEGETIKTEPRVVATENLVRSIKNAGFTVVTLANNHMFDCLEAGFHRVRDLLDELGVAYFGAGDDLDEASAPAIVEAGGLKLAFVAAVDERSGPYRFAGEGQFGVPALDVERLAGQIAELTSQVDHVIVSLHWGEERFLIPSPLQVDQAHRLIQAGASLVLGHHPHVIQGLEHYREGGIIYSLGNFVACETPFSDGDKTVWNRTERTGCILQADVTPARIANLKQVPTFDDQRAVSVDRSGFGDRRIARANMALKRVTHRRYRREHFRVKTLKPTLDHLRPSRLKHLRLRNVVNAVKMVIRGMKAD